VTMGASLIVSLVALYLVAMLVMWRSLRVQRIEDTPNTEVPFALQEGQTIIGVMDTTDIMCFCIGKIEEHVHDEEDTIK
jgi:hypothetical protein